MQKKEYNAPYLQVVKITLPHIMAGSVQEGTNPLNENDEITNGSDIGAKAGGSLWKEWDEE